MAHLLVLELPGGDDTDIIEAGYYLGHDVTFLSGDLSYYQNNPEVMQKLQIFCSEMIEVKPFDYPQVERQVLQLHSRKPVDAVLCLVDIRMIEASKLAEKLFLKFLNPQSAQLLRDKFSVRERLQQKGIVQPDFKLATSNEELRTAVEEIGLPVVIKPSDGYGSQNIVVLQNEDDLSPFLSPLDDFLPQELDYGLGVKANDRLLVEAYMQGKFIGCDTMTINGQHYFLGINEKQMFPVPSFAIRGSCFPSQRFDEERIRDYVFSILNAVEFDWGMAHIELMVTENGPMLVEVNPRLVGAKISRLLNLAFKRNIHQELVALHLGLLNTVDFAPLDFAISRWFVADQYGVLQNLTLPVQQSENIRHMELVKHVGDGVHPPFNNGDRIGYIMVSAGKREQAEQIAEDFIADIKMEINA